MSTIVTRAGKGSPLTHVEGDANFTNLNNDKMESFTLVGDSGTSQTIQNSNTLTISGGTGLSSVASNTDTITINLDNTAVTPASYTNASITVDAQGRITSASNGTAGATTLNDLTDVTITGSPMTGQVIKWSSATSQWTNQSGSGIEGLYADPNPSLGGNLTVMGFSIVSASNGDIAITPNGTGKIVLDGLNWPTADGTNGQVLSTNGTGQLSFVASSSFAPASPGEIGASTPDIGNFTDLKVKAASSTVKELQLYDQDNSNYVGFKSPTTVTTNKVYVLPATDGSATHVLQTDGSGNLSWAAASSFAAASPGEIGATTPSDASFLHLNVKSASSIVKELRLHDEDNSNYVGFKSPTNVGSNRIYTLPSTDGTNGHFLKTDGTGGLSWSAASGGGNLDDLTDVTITSPANTQILQYNNGIWSNQNQSTFAQASPGEIGASVPDVGNFTDLKVKSASSTVKELQLHDQDNSNYVGFKAPTTVSTNKVWVLPNADGTNGQVLSTNGTATLSWVTAGGGNSYAVLEHNSHNLNVNAGTGNLAAVWVEASDINGIVSVGGDAETRQFVLNAGTYLIRLSSAGMLASVSATGSSKTSTGGMWLSIHDVTNNTARHRYYQEGTQFYNGGSTSTFEIAMGPVFLEGTVAPTGTTTYEIRYDNATSQKQFNNYSSPGKAFRVVIIKLA